jgi:hypothetical protein
LNFAYSLSDLVSGLLRPYVLRTCCIYIYMLVVVYLLACITICI